MKKITGFVIIVVVSVFAAGNGYAGTLADSADTMTCGTDFVSVGDSEDKVLTTCGEPSFREGDHWTYSGVQGSFIYELTFGGGNILSIQTRMAD